MSAGQPRHQLGDRGQPCELSESPAWCRSRAVWQRRIVSFAGVAVLLTACSTTPHGLPRTATRPPKVGTCLASHLQLTLDRVVPGLAQQPGAFFRLNNTSTVTCTLDGYPTLQPISPSGQVIGAAVRNGGSYQISDPGPHPVVLTSGSSAYFGYGWTDVTQPEGSTAGCVNTVKVRSIPPGSQSSLEAAAQLPSVCPGGYPSVTAAALEPEFAAVGSPAKP